MYGTAYYCSRKAETSGATKRFWVESPVNISDGLTKALGTKLHYDAYKDNGPILANPVR